MSFLNHHKCKVGSKRKASDYESEKEQTLITLPRLPKLNTVCHAVLEQPSCYNADDRLLTSNLLLCVDQFPSTNAYMTQLLGQSKASRFFTRTFMKSVILELLQTGDHSWIYGTYKNSNLSSHTMDLIDYCLMTDYEWLETILEFRFICAQTNIIYYRFEDLLNKINLFVTQRTNVVEDEMIKLFTVLMNSWVETRMLIIPKSEAWWAPRQVPIKKLDIILSKHDMESRKSFLNIMLNHISIDGIGGILIIMDNCDLSSHDFRHEIDRIQKRQMEATKYPHVILLMVQNAMNHVMPNDLIKMIVSYLTI